MDAMKVVVLKLDDKLYERLEKLAKLNGFLTVSEYVKSIIIRSLGGEEVQRIPSASEGTKGVEESTKRLHGIVEKIVSLVERRLQDQINPFTSKIDDLARRIADVIERLEVLEARVSNIEKELKESREAVRTAASLSEAERRERKRTALDILKEQRAIFESDIVRKIRDRDSFFAKLQRMGAVVLELRGERVALDPEFWQEFVEKLSSLGTDNEDEIRRVLDPLEWRLFTMLRESALIYFDRTENKWKLIA